MNHMTQKTIFWWGGSSLTHLAEGRASAVILQAKSRHRDIRTLSLYTRPGPEAVARLTDNQFDGH